MLHQESTVPSPDEDVPRDLVAIDKRICDIRRKLVSHDKDLQNLQKVIYFNY